MLLVELMVERMSTAESACLIITEDEDEDVLSLVVGMIVVIEEEEDGTAVAFLFFKYVVGRQKKFIRLQVVHMCPLMTYHQGATDPI